MNRKLAKSIPLMAALAIGVASSAQAEDFWDVVVNKPQNDGAGNSSISIKLNGANVQGSWNDTNNDLKLDATETLAAPVKIYDRKGNLVLQSDPTVTDRATLETWAKNNADAILQVLFPAGLSETTGASDDYMLASSTVSHNLFQRITPFRKSLAKEQTIRSESKGEGKKDETKEHIFSSEVKGEVEYLDLKVNDYNGSAASLILGYSSDSDSGLNFSVTVPYRYTQIDDDVDSKSHFVGIDLSLKYPVKKWGDNEWNLGGSVFGSAYYLKTTTIEQSGNLKYGAGVFTSLKHDIGFGTLSYGIDYRIAKAYLPSSLISDNEFLQKAIDYVNDLDPVQTLSYGFNLGIPIGESAAVNLEVIRSNFISNDIPDEQKTASVATFSGSYFPTDTFELNLGVRYTFELDNVDSLGIVLGFIKKF